MKKAISHLALASLVALALGGAAAHADTPAPAADPAPAGLDCGRDDCLLHAGGDVVIDPAGAVTMPADRTLFLGSGWPGLEARNLPRARPAMSFLNGETAGGLPVWRWTHATSAGLKQPREYDVVAKPAAWVFAPPPGSVLRGCELRFKGYGLGATIPARRPQITLSLVGADGAYSHLGTGADVSLTYAAYAAYHALSAAPAEPRTIGEGDTVVVRLQGAGGANWGSLDEEFQLPTLDLDVSSVRPF